MLNLHPDRQAARILVVDPRPLVRAGLRALLRTDGFALVTEAADALQALALLRGRGYEVLVLPTSLPDHPMVARAARSEGAAWLVGLTDGPAALAPELDVLVSLDDPAHKILAAVQTGLSRARLSRRAAPAEIEPRHLEGDAERGLDPALERAPPASRPRLQSLRY